jgi:hypothetical protein
MESPWSRSRVAKLVAMPALADYFVGRDATDRIEIPDDEREGANL